VEILLAIELTAIEKQHNYYPFRLVVLARNTNDVALILPENGCRARLMGHDRSIRALVQIRVCRSAASNSNVLWREQQPSLAQPKRYALIWGVGPVFNHQIVKKQKKLLPRC
jgi:hypothetical protein